MKTLLRKAQSWRISNGEGSVSTNIQLFDGMKLRTVPTGRFFTKIDLTADGEGGFAKASDGYALDFVVVHPSAAQAIQKHEKLRYFAPDVNQERDAHKWQYRLHHATCSSSRTARSSSTRARRENNGRPRSGHRPVGEDGRTGTGARPRARRRRGSPPMSSAPDYGSYSSDYGGALDEESFRAALPHTVSAVRRIIGRTTRTSSEPQTSTGGPCAPPATSMRSTASPAAPGRRPR